MTESLEIKLSDCVCVRQDLHTADMDDELVMMDVEKGNYFGLGEIGSTIWRQLEQPQAVSALCERLVASYDVAPEQCQKDVLTFLGELRKAGLLEIEPAA